VYVCSTNRRVKVADTEGTKTGVKTDVTLGSRRSSTNSDKTWNSDDNYERPKTITKRL